MLANTWTHNSKYNWSFSKALRVLFRKYTQSGAKKSGIAKISKVSVA